MDAKEIMGVVSGVLVMISGWFYMVRTYQGKAHPNPVSFALWSVIGLALLLTYHSSGAIWNVLPAVFGFVNPCLICVVAAVKKNKTEKLLPLEWACLVCVAISLAMWTIMRRDPSLAQYSLYVAIVADYLSGIPHFRFVCREPDHDRPLAWIIFAVGFGLAVFAVPEKTFANYALPTSSFILGIGIAFPLIWYRWKNRLPAMEWI